MMTGLAHRHRRRAGLACILGVAGFAATAQEITDLSNRDTAEKIVAAVKG